MTYGDVYEEFIKKFPDIDVEDYRPAVPMHVPQLLKGIPYAIIVWLKDGSEVIYITNEKNDIIDKIREEIEDTLYVDSLIFGELIDFRNGKMSADDVIEEFNRVTRAEVLRIIDKYKAESEDEE